MMILILYIASVFSSVFAQEGNIDDYKKLYSQPLHEVHTYLCENDLFRIALKFYSEGETLAKTDNSLQTVLRDFKNSTNKKEFCSWQTNMNYMMDIGDAYRQKYVSNTSLYDRAIQNGLDYDGINHFRKSRSSK